VPLLRYFGGDHRYFGCLIRMKNFLTTTAFATLATLFALSGCKPPDVAYQEVQTASLRVLNFAPSCSVPLDIYWYPTAEGRRGNQANIYYLQYGNAAVYTNGIGVSAGGTEYTIEIHPTNDINKKFLDVKRTLQPGKKYTLAITLADPKDLTEYAYDFFEDEVPNPDEKNNAFVRFFNEQPGVGKLVLKINDPGANGQVVGSVDGEDFRGLSAYTPVGTKQDTSYTLFLTSPGSTVSVARLAYQTFVPGNHYTIVYSGDTCRIKNNADDTTGVDLLRLRNLDDNTVGNDLSNPIQPAFRYNIINITPGLNFPKESYVGFLVNGEGIPKHYGFSLPPVQAGEPGGSYMDASPYIADWANGDTIWDVYYQSASIPQPLPADNKLLIRGSLTDRNGTFSRPIFDAKADLLAMHPDSSFTILLSDSLEPGTGGGKKELPSAKSYVIPIPDESDPNFVTVVFIQGVVPTKEFIGTKSFADFWVSQDGGDSAKVIQQAANTFAGQGKYAIRRFSVPNGSSRFTVIDSIGAAGAHVAGPTTHFTGEGGAIYEVVLSGRKIEAYIRVLRVNKPAKAQ
jgi:hypothetical protein